MADARAVAELASITRDLLATDLFNPGKVEKAILARAGAGFRDIRIVQSQPFDLSRSAAARTLEDWLEGRGFRYAWSSTPPLTDPLHSALSEDYPELAIFW